MPTAVAITGAEAENLLDSREENAKRPQSFFFCWGAEVKKFSAVKYGNSLYRGYKVTVQLVKNFFLDLLTINGGIYFYSCSHHVDIE